MRSRRWALGTCSRRNFRRDVSHNVSRIVSHSFRRNGSSNIWRRRCRFKASHTRKAPWTVVDFNNQKLGRLNLIRDFIERFPDARAPVERPVFEPLPGKPAKERYTVAPKPIKPYY